MSDIYELRQMVLNFRVSELQVLLGFAGQNKTGKKHELQQRALELLQLRSATVLNKIRDLNRRRNPNSSSSSTSSSGGGNTLVDLEAARHASILAEVASVVTPSSVVSNGGGLTTSNGSGSASSSRVCAVVPMKRSSSDHHSSSSSSSHHHHHHSSSSSSSYSQSSLHHHNTMRGYLSASSAANPSSSSSLSSSSHHSHRSSSDYPPPAAPNSLLSAATSPTSNYPVHPDVKFKELPFYDVLAELMRPSSLVAQAGSRYREIPFEFHMTPLQVHTLLMSREFRAGNIVETEHQVQLRFCLLETSCPQEDAFPPNIVVKVNSKMVQLPNAIPTNKPGMEPRRPPRPLNITALCRLTHSMANQVLVTWASEYRAYTCGIFLVRRLTSDTLLTRLRNKGIRNADHTRAMIKEKLQQDPDSEISTTSLRASLHCPLGKMRMSVPCRSANCTHLQCFDASLYLQMNEKKPTWICPVCDKTASFKDLFLDGLFTEILQKTPSSCREVQCHEDGSWTPVIEKAEKSSSSANTSNGACVASSDSDDSDSDDDMPLAKKLRIDIPNSNGGLPGATAAASAAAASSSNGSATAASSSGSGATAKTGGAVIDLTLSSDEDEPAPVPSRPLPSHSASSCSSTASHKLTSSSSSSATPLIVPPKKQPVPEYCTSAPSSGGAASAFAVAAMSAAYKKSSSSSLSSSSVLGNGSVVSTDPMSLRLPTGCSISVISSTDSSLQPTTPTYHTTNAAPSNGYAPPSVVAQNAYSPSPTKWPTATSPSYAAVAAALASANSAAYQPYATSYPDFFTQAQSLYNPYSSLDLFSMVNPDRLSAYATPPPPTSHGAASGGSTSGSGSTGSRSRTSGSDVISLDCD